MRERRKILNIILLFNVRSVSQFTSIDLSTPVHLFILSTTQWVYETNKSFKIALKFYRNPNKVNVILQRHLCGITRKLSISQNEMNINSI